MSEPVKQELIRKESASVEYVPYGSQDKVKMTVAIIQNLIAVKTKSGKTCSDRDAIRFMAMAQAKRMNPFEGDCFLIGYDGRDGVPQFALVTAHQTYLKRAELHPEFDGMKSGVIVHEEDANGVMATKELEGDFHEDNQKVVGGWATVFFKNRKQPMHKRLKLSRFNKGFGVWNDDPAGMICKCAEADALRSAFPTMLGGLYLREEIEFEPKPAQFSKPLFNGTQAPAIVDAGPAVEPKPEPTPTATPEQLASVPHDPASGSPAASGSAFNPLKAIRGLLREAKVKEGTLLTYLANTGSTDGSVTSLEEVMIQYPTLLQALCDDWPEVLTRIVPEPK
jgi:phage recombination protein Bet